MGLRRRYTVMAYAPEHRTGRPIDRAPQPASEPPTDRDIAANEGVPTLDIERWFGPAPAGDR